jgi:hypothetical protein
MAYMTAKVQIYNTTGESCPWRVLLTMCGAVLCGLLGRSAPQHDILLAMLSWERWMLPDGCAAAGHLVSEVESG